MVYLYIHTGCRRSELVRLTWGDIEKVNGRYIIAIKKTKTRKPRTVKANAEVVRILDSMKRGKANNYVFPRWRTPDAITRLFGRYVKDSGIPRLHDLRHTTASHLVMAGVPLKSVAKILGHSRTTTTDIYAHLAEDHIEDAMSKLDSAFNSQQIENKRVVIIGNNKDK